MPGIDTAAPERTETSSGFSLAAELAPGRRLEPLEGRLHLGLQPGREVLRFEVGDAERRWRW